MFIPALRGHWATLRRAYMADRLSTLLTLTLWRCLSNRLAGMIGLIPAFKMLHRGGGLVTVRMEWYQFIEDRYCYIILRLI